MTSIEKKLKESEERFKALFKGSPVPTYAWQKVGDSFKLIDYNNAANIITHGNMQKYLGDKASEMYRERMDILEDLNSCFEKKTTINRELKYFFASLKEEKDLLVKYFFLPPDLVLVHTEDITERKKAEEKVQYQAKLVEDVSDAIISTDSNFNIISWNRAAESIYGWKAEDTIGKNLREVIPVEYPYDEEEDVLKIFFENGFWKGEVIQNHKDGTPINILTSVSLIKDIAGNPIGAVAINRDISERKLVEQKLKESEIIFRDLYEEAPNAYFSIGKDKSIIRCNHAVVKLLGYSEDELLKMKVFELYADTKYGLERAKKVFKQFLDGEIIKDVELQMKNKKGDPVWVSLSVKPIIDLEGNVIESRSMILDINERKLAQDKLENSYTQLRKMEYIINNSPGVVFLWQNSEGWPVEFVSENVKQFGYTPDDFYSGKVIYKDIIHPDDIERVSKEVNRHSNDGANDFVQEYRIITKSGKIKWLDDRTWIQRDSESNINHFQGITLDITDHKTAEDALKLSEKNYKKAYDRANFYKNLFTHDINNILQIINSSAELIHIQLGASEKSKSIENMASMIKNQVERGSKLVYNVRTLSELAEEDVSTIQVDICNYLKYSIDFVKKAYSKRNISISTGNLDENCFSNANEFLQDVFENILINGIKYNENLRVEISIKISKQTIDGKNYFKIEFIDNGIGVQDDRKKAIFQRGNRELKGSKGMGIGLSLVKKILKIFKGKIWVEDKIKDDYTKGSVFIVILPEVN